MIAAPITVFVLLASVFLRQACAGETVHAPEPSALAASDSPVLDLPVKEIRGIKRDKAMKKDIYPVTVIDARRFAGRAADLNELVGREAGVKVRASGGEGSDALLNIRGLEGKRVKVYINGHPLNSPDGSFGINDLPLQIIDRIEIYKGTVPAKFGGDGLGGAVNVVIKQEHRDYTDFSYTAKTLDNHNGYLVHKKVWKESGIELGVGGFGTLAENRYSMARPGKPAVERTHDGFQSLAAGFGLTFLKLGLDEVEFEGAMIFSGKELQGVPGYSQGSTQRNFRHARTENRLSVAEVHLEDEGFLLPSLDFDYSLLFVGYNTRFIDTSSYVHDFDGNRSPSLSGRGEEGFGPNLSDDRRWDVRQKIIFGHPLTAGFTATVHNDFAYSFIRPEDEVADLGAGGSVSGYPGELYASTSSLTLERGIVSDRVKFTASLKHHYFRSDGFLTDPWGSFTGTPDQVVQDHHAIGANAGLRFDILPDLWLKASAERAHRLPDAGELFGNGVSILGSAGLKPESGTNIDGGILWDRTVSGRRYQAEVNAYASFIANLIKLTGSYAPNYANVSEARILGVDGEIKADLLSWLYAYANGTFLDARDVGRYVAGTRQENFTRDLRLPNMPYLYANFGWEAHGAMGTSKSSPRLKFFWDSNAMHPYFYEFEVSRNQEKRIPGYLIHSAGAQVGFQADRYTLSAEVQNLADDERFDQYNNPLPGRVLRAKLRVTVF